MNATINHKRKLGEGRRKAVAAAATGTGARRIYVITAAAVAAAAAAAKVLLTAIPCFKGKSVKATKKSPIHLFAR